MKKQQLVVLLFLLVFTVTTVLPLETFAQSYSPEWRRHSSSISRKVNNLDSEKVIDLPLPILFGLTPANLTRNFGDPRSGGRTHEGLDILAPRRALVVSPTDAVVIRTGVGDSAGNYVYTANPGGETFAYMHLDEIADINEGDELDKGALIGYVGNTGNASGGVTHLHFEIRDNDNPTDPFPRLTRIFPIVDKIDYLKSILDNANDEQKLAEVLVAMYRKDFISAQILNITLPASITSALANKVAEVAGITRTLRLGMSGDDVKALQTYLGITADGSFGPKTKSAVVAFQASNGLTADGVFGPISRAALMGAIPTSTIGCTATTKYSPKTGAKCPVVL